jgi:hypothetical protein
MPDGIEEILQDFRLSIYRGLDDEDTEELRIGHITAAQKEAAKQIRSYIEEEIIGTDQHSDDPDYSGYEEEVEFLAQNELREEQRKKLREPMDKD